jgi:hypothetical protein
MIITLLGNCGICNSGIIYLWLKGRLFAVETKNRQLEADGGGMAAGVWS